MGAASYSFNIIMTLVIVRTNDLGTWMGLTKSVWYIEYEGDVTNIDINWSGGRRGRNLQILKSFSFVILTQCENLTLRQILILLLLNRAYSS